MKFFYLSILVLSVCFTCFSQAQKHDNVVEFAPHVGDLLITDGNSNIGGEASFRTFITDRLSIGCNLIANYRCDSYFDLLLTTLRVGVRPEIQYNLLRSAALTPFGKLAIGSINYERHLNQNSGTPNPQEFLTYKIFEPHLDLNTVIGLSYSLRERMALQVYINKDFQNDTNINYGISLLLILSKHSKILNPRNL
jgi:hypothetical protein